MKKNVSFVKTTLLGGLIFLLPVVIIVAVLGKAISIFMFLSKPIVKLLPNIFIGELAVNEIMSFIIMIMLCFLAGLSTRSSTGKSIFTWIDSEVLIFIPGYVFMKGYARNISNDDDEKTLIPVFVKLDDQSLMGFEVEKLENGLVAVYLPGSPDARSGTVAYMTEDRVERLDIDYEAAFKMLRELGRGSKQIVFAPN